MLVICWAECIYGGSNTARREMAHCQQMDIAPLQTADANEQPLTSFPASSQASSLARGALERRRFCKCDAAFARAKVKTKSTKSLQGAARQTKAHWRISRAEQREEFNLTHFSSLQESRSAGFCFDWIQSYFDSTAASGRNLASTIYGCVFHAGCVSTRRRAWF